VLDTVFFTDILGAHLKCVIQSVRDDSLEAVFSLPEVLRMPQADHPKSWLESEKHSDGYPLRRIVVWDPIKQKEIVLLTNCTSSKPFGQLLAIT